MSTTEHAGKVVQRLTDVTGRVGAWLVCLALGVVMLDVMLRALTGGPTPWGMDVSVWLTGSLYVISGAYAMVSGRNVRVDVFYRKYPARLQAWLDLGGLLVFFLPTMAAAFWYAVPWVQRSWALREVSALSFSYPVYPFKTMVLVGLALLILEGFAEAVFRVATLVRPTVEPAAPAPQAHTPTSLSQTRSSES